MNKTQGVLFWCMILGIVVLLVWYVMIVAAGERLHAVHTDLGSLRMMPLELFMSANYIGIGVWKMGVIFFFAIPWLAIKIVGDEAP